MTLSSAFIIFLSWLPTGEDFHAEALEFMRVPDVKGVPLVDEHSFQIAEAQREELRADQRDWEGVAAEVLNPLNGLEGQGAALSILKIRDSYGEERVSKSLKLLLDHRAKLAVDLSNSDPNHSIAISHFRSLVSKVAEHGSPELVQFICERLLEKESAYYPLFNETKFRFFFQYVGASGSDISVTALENLKKKLEADGKSESAERARVAAISIKRRMDSALGTSERSDRTSSPADMRKGEKQQTHETSSTSFTPVLVISTLVLVSVAAGFAFFVKSRK